MVKFRGDDPTPKDELQAALERDGLGVARLEEGRLLRFVSRCPRRGGGALLRDTDAAMYGGIGGFRHVMEWGMAMSPDARYEILGIIAEGDMVACRLSVSGTMQGEMFGVPATGKGFSAEHVHWHRVKDGKLAERWAVRDDLGTLIQLGIIDPPGRYKADKPD